MYFGYKLSKIMTLIISDHSPELLKSYFSVSSYIAWEGKLSCRFVQNLRHLGILCKKSLKFHKQMYEMNFLETIVPVTIADAFEIAWRFHRKAHKENKAFFSAAIPLPLNWYHIPIFSPISDIIKNIYPAARYYTIANKPAIIFPAMFPFSIGSA